MTNNLKERLIEHKRRYSPYTKKFSEIELVYYENYKTKTETERRELQLKGWSVAKKKALIAKDKDSLIKLSKSRKLVNR